MFARIYNKPTVQSNIISKRLKVTVIEVVLVVCISSICLNANVTDISIFSVQQILAQADHLSMHTQAVP